MLEKLIKSAKVPLILLGFSFLSFILSNYNQKVHFGQSFTGSNTDQAEETKKQYTAKISSVVQQELRDEPGRYAIYIKDIKRDEIYEFHAEDYFGAASIYKLAVMYKAYDEINNGNLKKDDLLSDEKITLDKTLAGNNQELNNQSVEVDTGEIISLNVENALESMITISDNYSALLLANKLGWKNIDEFLKDNNIQNFDFIGQNTPRATAKSISKLLEKIYSNTAINTKYSEEMKSLLLAQKINDRIPKYLPQDITVGHKTGELESLRHDAGIILGKNSHYIFVFLSDTPNPEEASENIAVFAQKIYEALEKP